MHPIRSARDAALRRPRRGGFVGLAIALLWLASPGARAFDAARAMAMTREQCAFGPRVPGTDAHRQSRDWLVGQIKALGMVPQLQEFQTTLPLTGKSVTCWNVWGLPAESGPTSPALILSAHWDTRPWADHDPSGGKPSMLGANDGAAAVAVALEVARDLRKGPLRDRVVLAFWDAEDAGTERDLYSWGLGAQYAADHPQPWIGRVALGINLDMIAGEDLSLTREAFSVESAPKVVEGLWRIGRALAPDRFNESPAREVYDDHLHWVRKGMPFVDLVDLNYRYWHTAGDTPGHCSPAAMQQVANVLENYLLHQDWPAQARAR